MSQGSTQYTESNSTLNELQFIKKNMITRVKHCPQCGGITVKELVKFDLLYY